MNENLLEKNKLKKDKEFYIGASILFVLSCLICFLNFMSFGSLFLEIKPVYDCVFNGGIDVFNVLLINSFEGVQAFDYQEFSTTMTLSLTIYTTCCVLSMIIPIATIVVCGKNLKLGKTPLIFIVIIGVSIVFNIIVMASCFNIYFALKSPQAINFISTIG